jgi:glycosyltransferase involved in cell wall biosynthesis
MVVQRFRPDFGGQGVQVEQLCQALARRGTRAVIISATRGRPSDWESCDGYRVRRLRADLLPGSSTLSHVWNPIFGLRVFIELLRLKRVDAVHVHGLSDGFYGASAFCRLRAVPLVFEMTLMGVDDPASVLASRQVLAGARHRAYRSCDAYVAMSRAFLPSYSATGMPAERLRVIPQGVETHRFRPRTSDERERVRAELGLHPADPVVVFVGSLIERKGIDVLLAAWAQVHAQRPEARAVLVGRSEFPQGSGEGRFLEEHLSKLSAPARSAVRVVGLRDDPERFLGAADAFAFPSRREGFGSVIIEAMACGLPCVVAQLEGITDFVFDAPVQADELGTGRTGDGIVVPQNDAHALSSSLLSLFADPAKAAAIAAAGLQRARAGFDFDRTIAPAYEQLYTHLTAARSRP